MVVRVGLLLISLILIGATVMGEASGAQWPADRQYILVEPPPPLNLGPPPSGVAETADGALLVRLYWPVTQTSGNGLTTERPRTRLVRITLDGSRAFVPALDQFPPIEGDDDILPLPDGSILFTRWNAIDRLRPDGSIVRFAGTGRYSEESSGDGGPATAADIGFANGLALFPDGSIVFAERSRVRRVAPDGIITTIAGSSESGFSGDGGPATAARLGGPGDVLPTADGGFLIADTYNGRVRQVSPEGIISTVAGVDKPDIFQSFGDGGSATAAGLALPAQLGRLPDGSLLIGEYQRIRRVAPNGTISTIFQAAQVHGDRVGDFAGRNGYAIDAMEATREGGIVVIVGGYRLRALYLAPRHTQRTLIALRDTRASQRRVDATLDTTTSGRVRLEVRRGTRVVATATRHVRAGRHVIGVTGRFAAAYHMVRVALRADRGGGYRDEMQLFTSRTLPKRLVQPVVGSDARCARIDGRRIDCERQDPEDESGRPCLYTTAYRLFTSGLTFSRAYGRPCHRNPIPFDRTPSWRGPWQAWPAR